MSNHYRAEYTTPDGDVFYSNRDTLDSARNFIETNGLEGRVKSWCIECPNGDVLTGRTEFSGI